MNDDPLFNRAVEIVTREGKVSTSFLVNNLRIGYSSAVRMIKLMEDEGIIAPADDLGYRKVLAGQELPQERSESQKRLPAQVDLSNKELKTRVEDELKNLLEDIRDFDNVYPDDQPQYMQELRPFTSDRSQKVRLEEYPWSQD